VQLHLLDGTYELFRSFFGAPRRTAPDGREVGAVHGLVASVLKLLAEPGVTHVAAAFDSVIESFRNDVFPGYKTSEGVDPDLLAQFPLAERAVKALGITVWSMYVYEADDALATAAMRWRDEVDQVVVMTPDKDLGQLYGDERIVGYDRRKGRFVRRADVVERFGVEPESIPDYLALVGDAADGIPGLRGWGASSAATVLGHYGHLERIPVDVHQWQVRPRSAAKLAGTLLERMDEALLYRYLAQLRTDVPLVESLDDLAWEGVPEERFFGLCDELGFGGIRERIPRRP